MLLLKNATYFIREFIELWRPFTRYNHINIYRVMFLKSPLFSTATYINIFHNHNTTQQQDLFFLLLMNINHTTKDKSNMFNVLLK